MQEHIKTVPFYMTVHVTAFIISDGNTRLQQTIFVLNYIKNIESWSSSQHQLLSRPSSANFGYKLPVAGILSINVLIVNKRIKTGETEILL